MLTKIINSILVIATVIGLIRYVRLQGTEADLRSERNRLTQRYGMLSVEDETRFYFQRIEQPEEAHFTWRVFVPENQTLIVKDRHLSGSGETACGHREDQALIRLRIGMHDGRVRTYLRAAGGSTFSGFAYPDELAELLWRNWDKLEVVTAADEILESDLSKPITLLSIRVPKQVRDQAVAEVKHAASHRVAERLSEPILVLRCGTEAAFADEKK